MKFKHHSLRPNYALWIGLLVLASLATLAAHYFPMFPGDAAVAGWVQSQLPNNMGWAEYVSKAAQFPGKPHNQRQD